MGGRGSGILELEGKVMKRLDGIFSSEEGFSLSTEDPAQSIGRLRHDRRFLISTVPICAVAEEYSFSLWPPLSGELRDGCSA
ncbi:hypothetical protein QC762_0033800 [Podospora pseudocomata]|uniref:Uncharacterized protein n=1 Tax=Podospora pseudocomata TaxID=2093779 RepID=A0ABR0GQS4_9PEZI|nr:hypothetical protein QC762_0033800 [Podospora pseudocomata]